MYAVASDNGARVHLAGAPEGLVQRCQLCQRVLVDYRGAMSPGEWSPHWWHGSVEVTGDFQFSATDAPADCLGGAPLPLLSDARA